MVCLGNMCVDTLHKGDNNDDDDDNNNNNNNTGVCWVGQYTDSVLTVPFSK